MFCVKLTLTQMQKLLTGQVWVNLSIINYVEKSVAQLISRATPGKQDS